MFIEPNKMSIFDIFLDAVKNEKVYLMLVGTTSIYVFAELPFVESCKDEATLYIYSFHDFFFFNSFI